MRVVTLEVVAIPRAKASLTLPSMALANEYLKLLRETARFDSGWNEGPAAELVEKDMVGHIASLVEGFDTTSSVRSAHFWLVASGGDLLGRVTIRYELGDRLLNLIGHIGYAIRPTQRRSGYGVLALRLALTEAHAVGLTSVVLVCAEDNEGSRRIIEHCGGLLQERFSDADTPDRIRRRYVITLSK